MFFYKKITHFKLTLPCPFTFKVHWMVRQGGTVRRAGKGSEARLCKATVLSEVSHSREVGAVLPTSQGCRESNTLHGACRGGNTRDAM